MNVHPLELIRGDDIPLPINIPANITGATIHFTVKDENVIGDSDIDDTTALFQIVVTDHADPVNGKTGVFIPNAYSNKLTESTSWVYDVQLTDAAGHRTTIIDKSPIKVILDVTRS